MKLSIRARLHNVEFWHDTDKTGYLNCSTYLHGPNTDKTGTGAKFIRAVLQIERRVNGPIN